MIKLKKLISDIADYKLRELTNKKKGKIYCLRFSNEYVCINDIILLQTNIHSSIFKIDECTTTLHKMYQRLAEKDYIKKCVLIQRLNNQVLLYNEGNHIATFDSEYLKYFENPLKLEYYAIDYKSPIMVKDKFNNKAFIMPIITNSNNT
ncbi:MAG: hypothetical protein VZR33_09225 [Methanosphaera sp.]|nr:hypothetical protein [Methanosphaera sp.]